MARYAEGWKLRKPKGRTVYIVRFTHNGRPVDRSTGTADPEQAAKEAARIYADFVQREPPKRPIIRRGDTPPLEELVVQWLSNDSTLDADTVDTWTVYGGHWLKHWQTVPELTEAACHLYRNARLLVVLASTVRKELSALRRFLAWLRTHGYLQRSVTVPGVPEKTTGKRYAKRRRVAAPDLTPRQVQSLIANLPEWSRCKKPTVPKFPIRARFIVAYDTSLRPGTLDAISVPEHYRKGSRTLVLTDDVDKVRWGRELPLTPRARAALDSICPAKGLIFGEHDYRDAMRDAAQAALPPATADRFCAAHLRSARLTHLLEDTGNLPGAQFLAGHRLVSTTARYTKPSFRAAEDALRIRGRSRNSGDARRVSRSKK